ncbi:MAG: protein-glutamate O-methyltransferase CheR [Elusimicrobia bacterium]|nr:protein-glutamate O-methyltransferase CheR [Elusimicrobiota bacterium]
MSLTPPPNPELDELKRYLRDRHGVDLSHYNRSFLERRLGIRMRHHNAESLGRYLKILSENKQEFPQLLNVLSVNVTEFFRDGALYDALRAKVLPVIERVSQSRSSREIRVWSAGCASGQEAYTLAMLLDDYFGRHSPSWKVRIYASDIQEAFLHEAKAGRYPKEKAAQIPPEFRRRYVAEAAGSIEVCPSLKGMVQFFKHDLATPPTVELVDLVFCRNVMIYFSLDSKDHILRRFHGCMASGAFLVLGGSEIILKSDLFELADDWHKIYQRIDQPHPGGDQPNAGARTHR